jgi:trigger factor
MHVEVTKTDGLSRELNLRVPKARWDSQVEAELGRIAKTVRHAGFRPGKVPVNVIRPQYEKQVRAEVLGRTISESADEALRQINLKIAGKPYVTINSTSDDIDCTIALDVLPEIPAIDFSGITVEKLVVQLPDDLITKRLANIAQMFGEESPADADHAATWNDIVTVNITVTNTTTGAVLKKEEDLRWILENPKAQQPADAILLSQKIGFTSIAETDVFNVLEPDALKEAGAVTTHITITGIQLLKPHPIDDSLAKKTGNETISQTEEWIKKMTLEGFEVPIKNKLRLSLLNALDLTYSFDLPPKMLENERTVVTRQLNKKANALTEKDKEEIDNLTKRRVKLGLLLGYLGDQQKIDASDDDVYKAINAMIANSHPSERKGYLEFFRNNPQAIESVRGSVYENKVTDWLLEKITVTEKPITIDELRELIKQDEDESDNIAEEHAHDEHSGHAH